ncbi:hypothetical protein FRC02_004579 [Tulasnella sp. 418]|nr:hypothetical protein FRC02_004579 [Tulasnella sp. 418]
MDFLSSLAARPFSLISSARGGGEDNYGRRQSSVSTHSLNSVETVVGAQHLRAQEHHLYPPQTPQYPRPKKWLAVTLRPIFIAVLVSTMIVMGVIIQVALRISEQNQGWRTFGIERFGGINFLKSVIPVVLVMPISYAWVKTDEALVKIHPYVILSRGNVSAEKSILLNYTGGRFGTLFASLRNRHWLVFMSSILCILNITLSPMASGLLTTRSAEIRTRNVQVRNQKVIGLNPTFSTLEFFVAASGYATAAAVHNLTDPPFVFGGWAAAEFVVPEAELFRGTNGTVNVPTQAVQTTTGCGRAETLNLSGATGTQTGGSMTISGTWRGCTIRFDIPNAGMDQFGVTEVSSCTGSNANIANPFKPVLFWFYSKDLNQASLTFCQPTIKLFNVVVEASLQTKLMTNITIVDENVAANNVSGNPQNGLAFNGVAFDLTNADPFVQARATSTRTGLPGAVYRAAQEQPGGIVAVMQNENAFAEMTNKVYLQFLSIVAKSTYFVSSNNVINSEVINWELRLYVYPIAAHSFTAALVLIAILGALIHFSHARARQNVYMSLDPGSIGATLSMSSHSKFISTLNAGDDEGKISRTLRGMRFGISSRTWQIAAQGEDDYRQDTAYTGVTDVYPRRGSGKDVEDEYDPSRALLSDPVKTPMI